MVLVPSVPVVSLSLPQAGSNTRSANAAQHRPNIQITRPLNSAYTDKERKDCADLDDDVRIAAEGLRHSVSSDAGIMTDRNDHYGFLPHTTRGGCPA